MPFSLFLAIKYLRPKRSVLSIISVISIVGVLLGVMVLVIVLSVMSGFDDMWRDKILGFNAHITVTAYGVMDDAEQLIQEIEAVPGVTGAAPFVQGLVFLQHGDRVFTPFVRGVDEIYEKRVSRIPDHMIRGEFSVQNDEVVIGADLARQLGADIGDRLLLLSPKAITSANDLYLPEELTVSGIFEIGMWDFDMGYIITSLDAARELYGLETGIHGVQVMTTDPFHAQDVAMQLEEVLGPGCVAQTWMQQNRQLFAALRVEKNMMFFLLIFITLVAAFGIMNTLITVAVQKTKEIGLLKALGFTSGSIMRIFLWQGWIAGALGTVAGVGFGLLVLRFRNDLLRWMSEQFGMELLPKELYHLSEIPASTSWADIASIAATVMIICTLAGVIPAYRAARLDPAKALRYE